MLQKPKKYFRKKSNPNSTQMKLRPVFGDNIGDPMFKQNLWYFLKTLKQFSSEKCHFSGYELSKIDKMQEDAGKIWDLSEIN